MNTIHDLRDTLDDQEKFAPPEIDVLADLNRLRGPGRRAPRWSAGLLAAAAVTAIVIGFNALTDWHTASPATPGSVAPPAARTTAAPAISSLASGLHTTDPRQVGQQQASEQRFAEQQAERAAQSADEAARAADEQVASAAETCTQATSSTTVTSNGEPDAPHIAAITALCARAYGARPGYTAQWVQTTVGALSRVATGEKQHAKTPIIVVQIHATFTGGGQNGETETMVLVLSLDGSLPPGTLTTGDALDLATLGTVHHT